MKNEIYQKIKYQISEKDRLRAEEKDKFFDTVDKNTLKLYYKIWSKILKKYKTGGLDDVKINFDLLLEEVYIEKYYASLYGIIKLDNKRQFKYELINVDNLLRVLVSDEITVRKSNVNTKKVNTDNPANLINYNISISEQKLRELLSKYNYAEEKEYTKSAKRTTVKGK